MGNRIRIDIDAYLRDCPPWDDPVDEDKIPGIAEEIARRFDCTAIYDQIDNLARLVLHKDERSNA